jgi:hypothetical protein
MASTKKHSAQKPAFLPASDPLNYSPISITGSLYGSRLLCLTGFQAGSADNADFQKVGYPITLIF